MALSKEFMDIIDRWQKNPGLFARECVGMEPSHQQDEAFDAVRRISLAKRKAFRGEELTEEEERLANKLGISIRSGHGTGKDAWLAVIFLWLLTCFPYPKGLATAPTSDQLRIVLWSEISKWIRFSAERMEKKKSLLSENFVWQTEKVFAKDEPKEWFIAARTANVKGSPEEQGEALAGLHAPFMILAADEASGLPPGVFSPLEGAMTQEMNFAILIGQMTKNSGYFYDSHFKYRELWECLHWNSEESELVSQQYIARMRTKYGEDSNMYRIRVKGDPPLAEPDALIPFEKIMAAVDRDVGEPQGPKVIGIDVARYGDDKSAILVRNGNRIEEIRDYKKIDLAELEGWAQIAITDHEPDAANVDVIGYGAGLYDRLKVMFPTIMRAVNVSNKSVTLNNKMGKNVKYRRLRDELWWKVREKFEEGTISIPNDDELIGELSTIKWKPEQLSVNGQIVIEGKPEMRKRGLPSPNKADALCLTYATNDSAFMVEKMDKYQRRMMKDLARERPTKHSWMGV